MDVWQDPWVAHQRLEADLAALGHLGGGWADIHWEVACMDQACLGWEEHFQVEVVEGQEEGLSVLV